MYIKNTTFKKEWEQLEKYYKKKHTRDEANFYYSMLKDLDDEEFLKTMFNVYNNCKYFPNIAEIREQVPNKKKQIVDKWKDIKAEPINEEERKELEDLLKDFK